jgi:hypothetical protein
MCAIIIIGAFLFAAVDRLEPNRRLAIVFKCAILVAGGAAIAKQFAFFVGRGHLGGSRDGLEIARAGYGESTSVFRVRSVALLSALRLSQLTQPAASSHSPVS